MKDGVVAVLPTLVREALLRFAVVLHEAVAVAVAVLVAPAQSRSDTWPDCLDGRSIAGGVVILTGQHDEQRRRVDGAIVAPEGTSLSLAISPCRRSCKILPGCASAAGSASVACVSAKWRRTPLAIDGSVHRSIIAVMMPSRPVLYQGMPA